MNAGTGPKPKKLQGDSKSHVTVALDDVNVVLITYTAGYNLNAGL